MAPKNMKGEGGAALVEFALILPVFMMLILGAFSGAALYNARLDLAHATREGARYGAAIDSTQHFANGQSWASNVRDLVVARSGGDLSAGTGTTAGISTDGVCVALVTGSTATVVSPRASNSTSGSTCCTGNTSDAGTPVQASARKAGQLE